MRAISLQTLHYIGSYLCISCLLIASSSHADISQLNTIEVLGTSKEQTFTHLNSTRLITQQDIQNSAASNLVDILRNEANLNIRSFFGDDRLSVIDIRGMGDTAVSNVLVLIDGIRINSNDLSSPDLSIIPLEIIDSIEIIRGNGSVRYGNGAVGGVINISTKRQNTQEPSAKLETIIGSYDLLERKISANMAKDAFAGWFNLRLRQTDGYRDNADLDTEDLAVNLSYTPNANHHWFVNGQYHHDDTNNPGNLSRNQFLQNRTTRRQTNTPFDISSTEELRILSAYQFNSSGYGDFRLSAGYRERTTDPNILNFSPLLSPAEQNLLLDATYYDLRAEHTANHQWFSHNTKHTFGIDIRRSDFLRARGRERQIDNDVRDTAKLFEVGGFIETETTFKNNIKLKLGYRQSTLSTKQQNTSFRLVNCTSIPVPPFLINCSQGYRLDGQRSDNWDNHSFELGLGYSFNEALFTYGNISRNFRTPNIEELILSSATLQPQTGTNLEFGLRYQFSNIDLALALFKSKTQDEIFFGFDLSTLQNVNFNLPNTTDRTGFEFDIDWQALATVNLQTKLGYVRAVNQGNDIPHVPRWNAGFSLDWQVTPSAQLLWSTEWVGSRFDGNDLANVLPQLRPYSVTDVRLNYTRGNFKTFLGVNNLFREVYSTLAFSQTFYPQPDRNVYAGVSYAF